MPARLDILQFLEETALRMRRLAIDRPSSITADMLRIAADIAHEAALLEVELLDAGQMAEPPANELGTYANLVCRLTCLNWRGATEFNFFWVRGRYLGS
jgi:hypothetical protein